MTSQGAPTQFWRNKRVAVTGAAGFIGSHVVDELLRLGAKPIAIVRDRSRAVHLSHLSGDASEVDPAAARHAVIVREADMQDYDQTIRAIADAEIVINCAARVGGIEYNIKHPGTIFRENMQSFLNVMEASRRIGVERVVVVSSACVYPRFCTIPTPEEEGMRDRPEPTNEGYGWAKRMEEFVAQSYAKEFGMRIAIARPYNAYGPRDNFDPQSSHVIPALIRRVMQGEDPLVVWGSGNQSRAFLFATDFARGILEVGEKYAVADPVNVGTDREVTIRELVAIICSAAKKTPRILFDTTQPEGQPRRNCDTTKMRQVIGWEPRVDLEEGIAKTVEWYARQRS
jgi:GDP-L-fucose synthase